MGQAARRLQVAVEGLQIGRGGDQRDVDRASEGGLADLPQLEPVRGAVQALEVGQRLLEGGQVEVGAHPVTEDGFGRRDLGRERRGSEERGEQRKRGRTG